MPGVMMSPSGDYGNQMAGGAHHPAANADGHGRPGGGGGGGAHDPSMEIFDPPGEQDHDLYEFLALEASIKLDAKGQPGHGMADDDDSADTDLNDSIRTSRQSKEPQEAFLSMESAVQQMRQRLFLLVPEPLDMLLP